MDTQASDATRLSLQFSMDTMHKHTWAQYSMNDLWSELNGLYAKLYITILCHLMVSINIQT